MLQLRSGLAGLCGSNDIRGGLAARKAGDRRAELAIDVYCRRIRKYVGAYHAVLGRLDTIVFTAGVGEHAHDIRAESLAGLQDWGIAVDPTLEHDGDQARIISPSRRGGGRMCRADRRGAVHRRGRRIVGPCRRMTLGQVRHTCTPRHGLTAGHRGTARAGPTSRHQHDGPRHWSTVPLWGFPALRGRQRSFSGPCTDAAESDLGAVDPQQPALALAGAPVLARSVRGREPAGPIRSIRTAGC